MTRTGVAIIGLGPAVQPHARSLRDLSDRAEVVWAASRTPERLAAFARDFPDVPTTTAIDAAIADPRVTLVLVLTPPAAHRAVAERAFAAGKHVLVEKPLELTVAQGEALVTAADRAGRVLAVMLQHRFRPASLRLRTLLAEGTLGEVEAASLTVPWWRPQAYYDEPGRGTLARDGGGVLLTQAIHTLDLFRSLVGITEVTAAVARTTGLHRMETEDYVAALLRLGNGAPGTLMATTAFPPGQPERIEVMGRLGAASLVGGALEVRWVDGREERVAAEGPTGSGASIMDFPHDSHRGLIAEVLDAIRDGRPPAVTGAEALESQRWVDRILARAREAT